MIEPFDPKVTDAIACPICNNQMFTTYFEDKSEMYPQFQRKQVEIDYSVNGTIEQHYILLYCKKCQKIFKERHFTDFSIRREGVLSPRKKERNSSIDKFIQVE
ncbi:MAG: hypothetical protein ACXAC2_21455 [Candidatus Kariarchaeaceae archaeon]|jgi:uncharacterized protein YbaR (Trm112 family)